MLVLGLGLSAASTLLSAEPVDQGADSPLAELGSLRWQHRIIVVDAQIPDAVSRLQTAQPAIDERDILWFVKNGLDSSESNPLFYMVRPVRLERTTT
ncbi:MAG: hypothetical protein VBE63_21205 [Lamprobacter sp.]|uniref:hypothetical protein n=1 Tax=Lamprobacter sp. TaxID=3100796 RepID=UPI002B2616A2|nr:hypothetical protein [Lamprobacter sp.]MEA3642439.1 hypothetical protein [Lamprobacter sp.]